MTSRRHRMLQLAAAATLIAVTWLGLLPWVARLPNEQREWRRFEQHGIDPSAMYYTELEAMRPILERLNQRQRQVIADRADCLGGTIHD